MVRMLVKLQSGALGDAAEGEAQSGAASLDREAMLVYAGKFDSMDGPVEITPEHLHRIADTHNGLLGRLKRMATGEIPLKHSPPVQLDHSTSAMHTVGRLIGELSVKEAEVDGEMKPALFGKVRILGADNVERVSDGRWTHLSIGADLESGKLTELTITPFPAAPNASLLKRAVETGKEIGNGVVPEPVKLSAGENMDPEKLKKHLMDKTQCSAEEAEKKLAEMPDDEKAKLSKDVEDEEKRLADAKTEEDAKLRADTEAKAAKLSAAKGKLTELRSGITKAGEEVRLRARQVALTHRLSTLRARALVTPAEIGKMDLVELAKKSDEAIDLFFKGFENRQPVIMTGQIGSPTADNAAQVAAKAVEEKRTQEMLSRMPFTAASLGKKTDAKKTRMAEGDPAAAPPAVAADPSQTLDLAAFEAEWAECTKMLQAGDAEGAKERLKQYLASVMVPGGRMSDPAPFSTSEQEQRMSALASDVKKLENDVEEIVKLVGSILD